VAEGSPGRNPLHRPCGRVRRGKGIPRFPRFPPRWSPTSSRC